MLATSTGFRNVMNLSCFLRRRHSPLRTVGRPADRTLGGPGRAGRLCSDVGETGRRVIHEVQALAAAHALI
jgi:hypothetical protein